MDLGIAMFVTDETLGPGELARLVEQYEFESLFLPEHTHIPTSRRTPFSGGGELPRQYRRLLDPFVALTAAACTTHGLKIGTGVLLVPQHDPFTIAKAVASLDRISGGRFLFGVGAGWNEDEMENHGADPRTRFRLMRERVEAMKAIWTQDEASYHGRHVDFDPVWSWPKPLQQPHPPILIGGQGPRVLDRVLAYGDGWAPNARPELAERIAELDRRAAEAGRGRIPVTVFAGTPEGAEDVERLRDAGVARAVFWVPPSTRGEAEQALERIARVAERAVHA
jgi:probable F420-dependent oxidoreductase